MTEESSTTATSTATASTATTTTAATIAPPTATTTTTPATTATTKKAPAKKTVAKKPSHRYAEAWDESDIILIVEGEKFHCHYSILKFNSPVFRAMFKGDFKEGSEKSVKLPGKEKEGFMAFLDLMYPISFAFERTTDRKILSKVLEYADEYQADSVKMHVDNIIYTKVYGRKDVEKNVQVVMEDLRMSEKFDLKETRRVSYNYLLSDDRCNSYDETVFEELLGDTKYDIVTGKLKKFLPSLSVSHQWDPIFQLLTNLSKEAGQK